MAASSDSPWLIVPSAIAYAPGNISISVDPTGLAPGTYQGNVSLRSPGLTSVLSTVHVTFRVNSAVDPQLTTDVSELTFSLTSGGAPQSQSLASVEYRKRPESTFLWFSMGAGSAGLTPSIEQGTTQPNSPVTVGIAADPAKFPIGTTSASLLILGTNFQFATIPITITVSPSPQKMALSQGGFTFVAVAGGGVTPPQTFEVLATGTGGVQLDRAGQHRFWRILVIRLTRIAAVLRPPASARLLYPRIPRVWRRACITALWWCLRRAR